MKYFVYVAALMLVTSVATAQQVYKSVDESGHVTYSAVPPKEAVKAKPVAIEPGPSDERVRDAERRAEEMKQQAQEIENSRKSAQQRSESVAKPLPEEVSSTETSGVPNYDRRPTPLPHVPLESPSGGDHPIYSPGLNPGGPVGARPVPLPAAR